MKDISCPAEAADDLEIEMKSLRFSCILCCFFIAGCLTFPGFSSGSLVPYRKGKLLWGYATLQKQIVITPQYSAARPFHYGLASVQKDNKWGMIDQSGNIVLPCTYPSELEAISEKLIKYSMTNNMERYSNPGSELYGLMDRQGNVLTGPVAWFFEKHDDGSITAVAIGERYDFDANGRPIENKNDEKTGGREGDTGPQLDRIEINGKWGFVDITGKVVVPIKYDDADHFQDGMACVRENGLYGYVNLQGELVIPARYPYPSHFKDGLALVDIYGLQGYIGKDGTEYWEK